MSSKCQLQQKVDAKNILIDTGPLSLLLIGSYKADKLKRFRIGSKNFDKDDLNLLFQFLQNSNLFITPHILAETNNIVENAVGKEEFKKLMENNMIFLKDRLIEIFVEKNSILKDDMVLKFGITDMSVFLSSKNKTVITIDWALRNLCIKNRISACHLDEITGVKWLIK